MNRAAPVVESLRLRLVACSLPTSEQTGKITGDVNRFVLNKLLILFYFARKRKRQSLTSPTAMEPLLPGDNKALTDLATDLVAKSNALAGRLHPTIQTGVGDLVRSMNCYYSNLIEGHRTHPVDIDRALAGDYSTEPEKRNLQLEAKAHIDVQRRIDLGEAPQPSTSTRFIQWVHKEFCEQLPDELLIVSDPKTGKEEKVVPGELRKVAPRYGALTNIEPILDDSHTTIAVVVGDRVVHPRLGLAVGPDDGLPALLGA